jgi:hypothetical protein
MAEWCDALLDGLRGLKLNISKVEVHLSGGTLTDSFKISHMGLDIIMRVRKKSDTYGIFEILENEDAVHCSYQFHCALKNFSLVFYEIDGFCRRHMGEPETAFGLRARKRLGDFFRYGLHPFMEINAPVGHCGLDNIYNYSFQDVLLYDVTIGLTVTDGVMVTGDNTLELKMRHSGELNGHTISFTLTNALDFQPLVQEIRRFSRTKTKFSEWQCDVLDAFMDTGKIRYKTQTHFETTSEVFSILLQGHGQTAFFQMRFNDERNDTNYYILMDMVGTADSKIFKQFDHKFPSMHDLVGDANMFLSETRVLKLPSDLDHRKRLLYEIERILNLMQNTPTDSDNYSALRALLKEIMDHLNPP